VEILLQIVAAVFIAVTWERFPNAVVKDHWFHSSYRGAPPISLHLLQQLLAHIFTCFANLRPENTKTGFSGSANHSLYPEGLYLVLSRRNHRYI